MFVKNHLHCCSSEVRNIPDSLLWNNDGIPTNKIILLLWAISSTTGHVIRKEADIQGGVSLSAVFITFLPWNKETKWVVSNIKNVLAFIWGSVRTAPYQMVRTAICISNMAATASKEEAVKTWKDDAPELLMPHRRATADNPTFLLSVEVRLKPLSLPSFRTHDKHSFSGCHINAAFNDQKIKLIWQFSLDKLWLRSNQPYKPVTSVDDFLTAASSHWDDLNDNQTHFHSTGARLGDRIITR